jgi:hypothetical protein
MREGNTGGGAGGAVALGFLPLPGEFPLEKVDSPAPISRDCCATIRASKMKYWMEENIPFEFLFLLFKLPIQEILYLAHMELVKNE